LTARANNVTPLHASRSVRVAGERQWPALNAILLGSLDREAEMLAALEQEFLAINAESPEALQNRAVIASLGAQIVVASYGDFFPLRQWVDRLLPAIEQVPADPMARLQLASGLMCAFDHAGEREMSLKHGERIGRMGREALLELVDFPFPSLVIAAYEQLPSHYAHTGENAHASYCIAQLELLAAHATVDERIASRSLFWAAGALRLLDEVERSQILYARAAKSAGSTGWRWLQFQQIAHNGRPAWDRRDAAGARKVLIELEALVDESRPYEVREVHHLAGWLAIIEDDPRRSEQHHRLALEAMERGAAPPEHRYLSKSGIAHALVAQKKFAEGIEWLRDPPASEPRLNAVYEATVALIKARWAWSENRHDDYANELTRGFAQARDFELVRLFLNLPLELSEMCADALEQGIEPEFIRKLIARRNLTPPVNAGATWPWPIRVSAMGVFAVTIDGKAADAGQRGNDHRLNLLKLLAANEGKPLGVQRVIDALWPDAEPDNGRKSFDMALSRLRKLVGRDEAFVIQEGKLAASDKLVWIDTAAFIALTDCDISNIAAPQLAQHAERLIAHYRRGFLDGDADDISWQLEPRERFKLRFTRAAGAVSSKLVGLGEHQTAVRTLEHALEAEPLAENLYQKLMQIHGDLGSPAEVMRVYRRCRKMLSVLLSIAPSAETEALVKRFNGSR
jgi:LuxR family transcriptional regulator, maltose regulon positive regulatory protein